MLKGLIISSLFWSSSWCLAKGFNFPQFTSYKLKNGLSVYLMEQNEVPLIEAVAAFTCGSTNDRNVSGLAYLTAKSMELGSSKYTKENFQSTLDNLGASWSTYAGTETVRFSLSSMKKDFDALLPLFHSTLVNPAFPKDHFTNLKKRTISKLEAMQEQPSQLIGRYFNRFAYGLHPYGNPTMGTIADLKSIETKSLRSYYDGCFSPANAAIFIVGDLNLNKMKSKIDGAFKDWSNPSQPPLSIPETTPSKKVGQVLLVDKPDAFQSTFIIGGMGIPRTSEHYLTSRLANTILGGRFTSWLNNELRVKSGLTYGARSRFTYRKLGGSFMVSSFTKTDSTIEAIDLAYKTYQRIFVKSNFKPETVKSAKTYSKGQYPSQFETPQQLAFALADLHQYDLEPKTIEDVYNKTSSIKIDQLFSSINKIMPKKENTILVVIGQAKKLRKDLKKYGKITEVKITDPFDSKNLL